MFGDLSFTAFFNGTHRRYLFAMQLVCVLTLTDLIDDLIQRIVDDPFCAHIFQDGDQITNG
jgi:hypothetical protein